MPTDESLPTAQPSFGIRPPGDRLPDGTRAGAVHLQVGDLSRSVEYYTNVLGLGLLGHEGDAALLGVPAPLASGLQRGGSGLLVALHERRGIARVPRGGRFGLFHFAILLPDRPALGRFAAHLQQLGVRAGMADHAVSEALYLNDPDGLGIEVYTDRPRSVWQQRGRELVMVTEPLDLDAVLAAGEGKPWDGVPPGTVMGHVHLHTGDLAQADAFYHATLGFDKTVWTYPGALFLSVGGYHHHLATNVWSAGPAPGPDEAQLLAWELVVPDGADIDAIAHRLAARGHPVTRASPGWRAADPWGTRFHIVGARGAGSFG